MALHIRFDHRFERLADALLDALDASAGDALAERTVIVPSIGVGRWLQRRDAGRHGVSARLRPEFAGRWLWQAMRAAMPDLPERSPFEPERV
ncbi:MAG TPA: exodeoxyribonuclease V subunit gamma, partial [Burkholderiaceae bacterium]|nr:exodeoxyribonuclease V subunit gamma [Burkholderiaceae bacterium]